MKIRFKLSLYTNTFAVLKKNLTKKGKGRCHFYQCSSIITNYSGGKPNINQYYNL